MANAMAYLAWCAGQEEAATDAGAAEEEGAGAPPWRPPGGLPLPGPPSGSAGQKGAGVPAGVRSGVPAAFAGRTTRSAGGTLRAAPKASSADAGEVTTWTDSAGKVHTWRVPEKSKTGIWNRFATLVALHMAGETTALQRELDRLASWSPIQPQLAEIRRGWERDGLEAFYSLGYLPRPRQ